MGEDGNPPDLRYSRDLCESVKHNDQFQFTSARERSRLVNVLTGECHWFQADSAFEISASGWGYIVSSNPAGEEVAQWVTEIFAWSIWRVKATQRLFAYRKTSDGIQTRWLTSFMQDRCIAYAPEGHQAHYQG